MENIRLEIKGNFNWPEGKADLIKNVSSVFGGDVYDW